VTWTTVPRWLYENDLPDEQLQRIYVEGARRKLEALEAERAALDEQIANTKAFLAEARDALARYRRRLGRGP
jgi:hypothetical protein